MTVKDVLQVTSEVVFIDTDNNEVSITTYGDFTLANAFMPSIANARVIKLIADYSKVKAVIDYTFSSLKEGNTCSTQTSDNS